MDKRRTIYKLVDLRACIILSLLNLLSGAFLLGTMKAFPRLISGKIEERLLTALKGDLPEMLEKSQGLLGESVFYFHSTAVEAMIFSVVALTSMLLLIRLNGQVKFRKTIAWLITGGVSMVNIVSIMFSFRFMNSGSIAGANQGIGFFMALGFVVFFAGLIILFFKTLSDLTQPRSVL